MPFKLITLTVFLTIFILACGPANTQPSKELAQNTPMTNALMDKLLREFSDNIEGQEGFWRFSYNNHVVQIIADDKANRMRIVVPVSKTDTLTEQLSYRLLQANFDSALDARYAIANGVIFSTFIHPLKELDRNLFFSGLAQSITLAENFGTSFSSGALRFNGGDSAAEERKLYEEIIKKGEDIVI